MAKKKREYAPDVGSIEAPRYPALEEYFVDPVQKLSRNPVGQFVAPAALAEYLHKLNYGDRVSATDRGLAALDSTLLDKPAALGLGALAKGAGALKGVAAAAIPYRFKASKLAEELWDTPVIEEAAAWGTKGATGKVPEAPYKTLYNDEGTRLYVPNAEADKYEREMLKARDAYAREDVKNDFMERFSRLYRESPLPFKTGEPLTVRGFHGSKRADIERFKKKLLGKNTNAQSAKLGTFITGSPYNADRYARQYWSHDDDPLLDFYTADDRYGRRLEQVLYPDHIPPFEKSPAYNKLYNQWLLEKDNSGLPVLSRAASKNPDDPRFYREYMDQEFKPSSDYRFDEESQYAFDDYIKRKAWKLDDEYMPTPIKISPEIIDSHNLYRYNIDNHGMPLELSKDAENDLYYALKSDYINKAGTSRHYFYTGRDADDYAKRQLELIKRKQQEFKKAQNKSAAEFEDFVRRADVRLPEYGSTIYPVYTHFENPLVRNWDGGNYREHSFSKFIRQAIDEGHDGAILANASDPTLDNIFVQFKPHRIRSQFAKFDKSKRKSDDITKAKGGMIERTTRDRKIL